MKQPVRLRTRVTGIDYSFDKEQEYIKLDKPVIYFNFKVYEESRYSSLMNGNYNDILILVHGARFMNPSTDPQGVGYHLNQALIAVGSGRWFGVGLGHSRQKYGYLPEVAGDSIFPVIAEELGFILCAIYVILIFILVYHGLIVAKKSKTYYGRVLATGIIVWIGFQSFINIASMIGLLPMTGVPLPFLSYGGTAMIMNLAAMGILINISRYTRQ